MEHMPNKYEAEKRGKKAKNRVESLDEEIQEIVESLEKVGDSLKDLRGGIGEKENKKLKKELRNKKKKMVQKFEKKDRERVERIQEQEELRQLFGEAKERKAHDQEIISDLRQSMDTSFQSDIREIEDQNREELQFYDQMEDQQEKSIKKNREKRKEDIQRVKNAKAKRVSIGDDGSGSDSPRSAGGAANWGSGLDGGGDEFPLPDGAGVGPLNETPEFPGFDNGVTGNPGTGISSNLEPGTPLHEPLREPAHGSFQQAGPHNVQGFGQVGGVNDPIDHSAFSNKSAFDQIAQPAFDSLQNSPNAVDVPGVNMPEPHPADLNTPLKNTYNGPTELMSQQERMYRDQLNFELNNCHRPGVPTPGQGPAWSSPGPVGMNPGQSTYGAGFPGTGPGPRI